MAKFRKKLIFIVILALCLATCLTLVACNPDEPSDSGKYSVTVKIGDTPHAGVTVVISNEIGITTDAVITGTDGKATFSGIPSGTCTITLSNLPAYSKIPANSTLTI